VQAFDCSEVKSPKNLEARKMVETIKYEVIREIGKVEIRRYPKIVVAKVEDPQADAFSILYRFITGHNQQKLKVKMTTPVVSQQISMTSPVFSETGTMAFVMPEEFTFESTPEPLDNSVRIVEIPARVVAALCFSGGWSEGHFEKEVQELLHELTTAKIKTVGAVFTMLYNPPFIPGFLRRNEVAVEIEL
jgi:hypothetical protein